MATFRLSASEVEQDWQFVSKKIKEYRARRMMPPLDCDELKDVRWNRKALFETLRKLGTKYLSSSLLLPKVNISRISTAGEFRDALRQVRVPLVEVKK